jgi:mannose-1-phosphate guanylyltransferase
MKKNTKKAKDNKLVTFGITPETGFGYIESINVKAFHDFETATSYLKAGNYYWNVLF